MISKTTLHFKPIVFDLKLKDDNVEFSMLLEKNPSIEKLDEINSQLEELIKLKHPKNKFTAKELKEEILKHLKGASILHYGVWVYYPWLNKVIHLLGEKEFVEVRTNRNQNKITKEEQEILKSKKIGVIGLSVGKAIALTIATERICGELVLADFDVIELSNLNRIQTGVQNFGVKKTIVVAREIAEIDPYLKVTCLHDGLTEENVDDFFTKNGKLDICIEVCDGLFTKIFSREKAKEYGIPVVMDTNDRGMIDIERFDMGQDRPLFHGLTDHLDFSNITKSSSSEDKIPFVNSIIGINTMSNKLKESMSEIGKSLTTWPQLSSSVVLGGALTCNVCRRILLNQFTSSGRYFVDVEEQINDNSKSITHSK